MSLYLYQAGLGLPNRDYYLKPEFKPQREAYRAYIERTFKTIGNPNPAAAADRAWSRSKPRSRRSAGRAPTAATSTRSTTR